MKFISAEFGQTLQLVHLEEVRPLSGVYPPDFIQGVADRYKFVGYPTNIGEAIRDGYKFQTGVAVVRGESIPIASMDIYSDGIVCATRHTDHSDAIVSDAIEWLNATFKFREPSTRVPRRYASQAIVELSKPLDRVLRDMEKIIKIIEGPIKKATGRPLDMHVARLQIGADPVATGIPAIQTTFMIEPRAGVTFDTQRYYVGGPLTTPDLLELVGAIERVL